MKEISQPISNSATKQRDSNMELLRILTMLLVMVVHADFRALSMPTFVEAEQEPCSTILRLMVESFSIICVNVFVLLSGWYGIKFKISRLVEFLFQVAFFSILLFVIYFMLNPNETIALRNIASLFLLKQWDYWFVKAYLGLYIFAPILNTFVEHSSQKQFKTILAIFYAFQILYAWLSDGAKYFESGYSALSFMGLYLLARYIKLYALGFIAFSQKWGLAVYTGMALLSTSLSFLLISKNLPHAWKCFAYTSPLVIFSAVSFLLFFTRLKIRSRFINWVAISSFAVYLLHSNSFFAQPYYDEIIKSWFDSLSLAPFLAHVIPFIVIVFALAIFLDKIRILAYRGLMNIISKTTNI